MTGERYPFLRLTGSPHGRGVRYGQVFTEKIALSIESYMGMFRDYNGVSWPEARKRATGIFPYIREFSPKLVEEMEGIAEGSGRDFEDILTLNCRSEIVLDSAADGCTLFGLTPEVTSDGKTFLCQTWDWIRRQENSLVVIEIEQQPEPAILMIAEAGVVSGKGINSHGLGVGFNALATGKGQPGVPVHILLRGLLDAPHLADAVQAVATSRRASSANFIVGSREGEIIEIESSPEDFWVDYAEKGWLAHTNHFITPLLMNRVSDKSKVMLPDSFQRLGRIRTLVAGSAGRIGFAECTEFMSDHRNFPDSICRHEDPRDPEGKQVASVYATVMDLTEGILWLSPSNPCRGGFEAYGPVPAATETNR